MPSAMNESAEKAVPNGGVLRTLIVDDHPLVRRCMADLLNETEGFVSVGEVSSREEALQTLKDHDVEIALVDLSLGETSGLELIKQIVANSPDTRVLVLSMHDETLFAHRCLEAGASGYVCKQETPDVIVQALRTVGRGDVHLSPSVANDLLERVVGRQQNDRGGFVAMLTDREYQVFEALGQGLTVREIAAQLFISRKTVENHRDRIKAKLGLSTANELLRHAVVWNIGASALNGAGV